MGNSQNHNTGEFRSGKHKKKRPPSKFTAHQNALLHMEWGFRAHEKGMNLQEATIRFNRIYKGK